MYFLKGRKCPIRVAVILFLLLLLQFCLCGWFGFLEQLLVNSTLNFFTLHTLYYDYFYEVDFDSWYWTLLVSLQQSIHPKMLWVLAARKAHMISLEKCLGTCILLCLHFSKDFFSEDSSNKSSTGIAILCFASNILTLENYFLIFIFNTTNIS